MDHKRRQRNKDEWLKKKLTYLRNSKETKFPPVLRCAHVNNKDCTHCSASQLTMDDIQSFYDQLYTKKTAAEQNRFLAHYIVPYTPSRKRPRTKTPRSRLSCQYAVRKLCGNLVVVCAAAFGGITSISRKRLNTISKTFFYKGDSPTEKRGGRRCVEMFQEVTESIKNHIKKFSVRDSHYNRKNSCRQYLDSSLSIAKMYRAWKKDRIREKLRVVTYNKYREVFRKNFNLSFRTPRTDVCSTCEEFHHKVRAGVNKAENLLLWKVHKTRAKKFYSLLKESRNRCNSLTVAFDLQKNLVLPKTNIGQEYYSRQLYLHNLAIVIHERQNQSAKNVFFYCWLESQSGKGSNEICSALANFLLRIKKRVQKREYRHLELFSDGCPGQNKNQSMIAFLLQVMNAKWNVFKSVSYVFPIRGHSFIPPDRVFGRVEKVIRRKDVITTPEEYYKILSKQGRVKVLGKDWNLFNYRHFADTLLKRNSQFGLRTSRVWKFKKNSQEVTVQQTYSDVTAQSFNLLRNKNTNLRGRKPLVHKLQTHVSHEKKKDVLALLQYVPLTAEARDFYNEALKVSVSSSRANKKYQEIPVEVNS